MNERDQEEASVDKKNDRISNQVPDIFLKDTQFSKWCGKLVDESYESSKKADLLYLSSKGCAVDMCTKYFD